MKKALLFLCMFSTLHAASSARTQTPNVGPVVGAVNSGSSFSGAPSQAPSFVAPGAAEEAVEAEENSIFWLGGLMYSAGYGSGKASYGTIVAIPKATDVDENIRTYMAFSARTGTMLPDGSVVAITDQHPSFCAIVRAPVSIDDQGNSLANNVVMKPFTNVLSVPLAPGTQPNFVVQAPGVWPSAAAPGGGLVSIAGTLVAGVPNTGYVHSGDPISANDQTMTFYVAPGNTKVSSYSYTTDGSFAKSVASQAFVQKAGKFTSLVDVLFGFGFRKGPLFLKMILGAGYNFTKAYEESDSRYAAAKSAVEAMANNNQNQNNSTYRYTTIYSGKKWTQLGVTEPIEQKSVNDSIFKKLNSDVKEIYSSSLVKASWRATVQAQAGFRFLNNFGAFLGLMVGAQKVEITNKLLGSMFDGAIFNQGKKIVPVMGASLGLEGTFKVSDLISLSGSFGFSYNRWKVSFASEPSFFKSQMKSDANAQDALAKIEPQKILTTAACYHVVPNGRTTQHDMTYKAIFDAAKAEIEEKVHVHSLERYVNNSFSGFISFGIVA